MLLHAAKEEIKECRNASNTSKATERMLHCGCGRQRIIREQTLLSEKKAIDVPM